MKKSIMMLALMGLAGAACASSSLQIYGSIDLGLTKGNGGNSMNPGGNIGNAWQIKQASASRVGFRGVEDLGGGMSALFQLEQRYLPDTGEAIPPAFMQSTVSLRHNNMGTVWMGRDYTPMFWVGIKTDPFGMDGAGQIGPNLFADFVSNTDSSIRSDNTLGFKSKSFNGLTFDLAFSMKEQGKNSQSGMNIQYQSAKIYSGLGYAKVNQAVSVAPAANDELINAAFVYNFDVFRLMTYVAQAQNKNLNTKTNLYSLGLDAPIGYGRFKLAFSQLDGDFKALNRTKFGIGYDHNLSKSTRLYADYGVAKQTGKSSNATIAFGIRQAF